MIYGCVFVEPPRFFQSGARGRRGATVSYGKLRKQTYAPIRPPGGLPYSSPNTPTSGRRERAVMYNVRSRFCALFCFLQCTAGLEGETGIRACRERGIIDAPSSRARLCFCVSENENTSLKMFAWIIAGPAPQIIQQINGRLTPGQD